MARLLAPLGVVVLLLGARWALAGAGSTPLGQTALVDLTDLTALKAEFNGAAETTRLIVLVSPSCPYCLRGASTVQGILATHADRPLSIFVIWQPIQPTDWGRPQSGPLHRIADRRAHQFWDGERQVAAALSATFERRDPQPNCCYYRGIWWDMLAVFPPGGQWTDTLPEPLLLDGTVEDAAPAFKALLETDREPRTGN